MNQREGLSQDNESNRQSQQERDKNNLNKINEQDSHLENAESEARNLEMKRWD